MHPQRWANLLAIAGVVALLYFGLLRPEPAGVSFGMGLGIGGMILQYAPQPFMLPLYLVLGGLITLTQLLGGQVLAFLAGVGLGVALPYLLYRWQSPQSPP